MWTKENIPDQSGKTAIVTGANTGIGFETALALYESGAHVIVACRSQDKAEQTVQKLQAHSGKGSLETGVLDLSSLQDVNTFADNVLRNHRQLHLLINNAGVMRPPAAFTAEGYELQFGVNFLAHFALTGRLYSLLKATPGARVVNVSSLAYLYGSIDFNNLKSEISYDPVREYSQSKLANILFTIALQSRMDKAGDALLTTAVHPGATNTELSKYMTTDEFTAALERFGALMEPWQGALPSLYAATDAAVVGGAFYGPDQDGGIRGYPTQIALQPHALDTNIADQLWQMAESATGIYYPVYQ